MFGLAFIATIGAVQGALLLILVALRYRRLQNLPLALLLLVYSLRLGTIPLWNPVSMSENPWLFPLTTPLPFLFGPLLWRYTHELSDDSGVRSTSRTLLHFLPYVLDFVFTALLVVVLSDGAYRAMVTAIFDGNPPLHLIIRNSGKVVVNVVYVALAARLAFRRSATAEMTRHQRMWLRWLVVSPVASLVLFCFVALSPAASRQLAGGNAGPFVLLSIAMALLIYIFSLLILLAPEVPSGRTINPRYARGTQRSEDEFRTIMNRVDTLFTAGEYRDPELSLDSLADSIGVHPNQLSHAINHVRRMSFPAFVNKLRLDYFVKRAEEGDLEQTTILDLAFEAGFSSKSTFNRVFKASYRISPSQFKHSIGKNES